MHNFKILWTKVEFPNIVHSFIDDSDFQMESSASFPKIDATDLLEMRGRIITTRMLKEAEKPGLNDV